MPSLSPSLLKTEADKIAQYLSPLKEDELRKIIFFVFHGSLSNANIQDYHGTGEHGTDLIGIVDKRYDPFGKTQVFLIQVKCGKISLPKWRKHLCGQLAEAFCSTTLPREASEDNSRRIILILNGKLTPQTHNSIKSWNKKVPIPIEVVDIIELSALFVEKYNMNLDKIKQIHRVI